MRKALAAAVLALITTCSIFIAQGNNAWAQDVQDTSAPPIVPDSDYSVPGNGPTTGQIHGFIPADWAASMITLVDLQTQDGQNWFHSLSVAQSIHDQTQFVCKNPGPTTTSANSGDFFFYDLPPGSYVVAACMESPDGRWRSGASVIALNPGQDALVALGPAGGPVMRSGVAFVPNYYVGLWAPVGFGVNWVWGWPVAAWHPTVFYVTPVARIAPIWVRPAPIVVGARIFVPPYNDVIRGNYTYLAFRNGGFVQTTPRPGVVVPPAHVFHPVTPEAEAQMHVAANVRTAQPNHEPVPVFGNEERNDAKSNESRSNGVVSNEPRTDETRPAAAPRDAARPAASTPAARGESRPAPPPRAEARPAPAPAPVPTARPEARPAPTPRPQSKPAPAPHEESHPAPHNESHLMPEAAHTWAARRTT